MKHTRPETLHTSNNNLAVPSHPLYGNGVLLYIGMVDDLDTRIRRTVASRLTEHDYYFNEEYCGESQVYVASIDERQFEGWSRFYNENNNCYPAPAKSLTQDIGALLIFAHQPIFNTSSRKSADGSEDLRVFNTGSKGLLAPEVSGLFHLGSPAHFIGDKGDN